MSDAGRHPTRLLVSSRNFGRRGRREASNPRISPPKYGRDRDGCRPVAAGGRRPRDDVTTQPKTRPVKLASNQEREMGDAVEARMNVAALRRVDPYARDIVDSSAHVALYAFGEQEWAKTGIEGALFVYRRSGPPNHSLLVMNRLHTENLIEPVTAGLELQLQEPFLLYRNAHRRIFGLWFYDRDECARIANKIENLLREADPDESRAPVAQVDNSAPPQDAPVDIFTMLSKAQNDYNSKAKPAKATPRAPDIASQSVMDFFAKAGGTAKSQQPATTNLFGVACPRPPVTDEGAPMILQRLMSNPVHSVEHIEKQQRSVTPKGEQKKAEAKRKSKPDPGKVQNQKLSTSNSTGQQPRPDRQSNGQSLESELSFMTVSTPKRASPLANFLNQSRQKSAGSTGPSISSMPAAPTVPEPSEDVSCDARPPSTPLVSVQETPQKPALMPPTMFTSSAAKANVDRSTSDPAMTPIKSTGVDVRPEPLTRNQLLQALNYLIKNDADFMTKLHEAYVKSFSELVS